MLMTQRFVGTMQRMHASYMPDDCELNPEVGVDDGYAHETQTYPSTGNVVKGRLQEVLRVPGTPEAGATTLATNNFLIRLPAGLLVLDAHGAPTPKLQVRVNRGSVYQVQTVYGDKKSAMTQQFYCYKVV